MRSALNTVLFVAMLVPACRQSAAAQVARAAIGGGLGLAGGAVITLSVIVARARFQGAYLESIDDLIHWQTVPLIVAPAVGVMFGLAGRDPFVASIVGSTAGMVIGATAGGLAGWLTSDTPEWPWAGAVMGAGAGLTIGGLLLGIRAWVRDDDGDSDSSTTSVGLRIPL